MSPNPNGTSGRGLTETECTMGTKPRRQHLHLAPSSRHPGTEHRYAIFLHGSQSHGHRQNVYLLPLGPRLPDATLTQWHRRREFIFRAQDNAVHVATSSH